MRAAAILCALLLASPAFAATSEAVVKSPDGKVELIVSARGDRLHYSARFRGRAFIEDSSLGIFVDAEELAAGATIENVETYKVDEKFAWRGVHAEARAHANGARLAMSRAGGKSRYQIDLRVFDDAVAFRFVVPGAGSRVPDAATSFRIPAGSTLWYHGARDHYEGLYARKDVKDAPADQWAAPPLTFRLPNDGGFASITEAALRDYAGMMLQSDGKGAFLERLGHSVPASYPYTLRYGEVNANRLSHPATLLGTITTPWRVVLVGADLNALVNSDAIAGLCSPPDPKLFPQGIHTPWLRTGRAVWRYLDGPPNDKREGESDEAQTQRNLEVLLDFSRMAGELGFEHQIVEGVWRRFSDAQLHELVDRSREKGVSIWLWLHSRDQRDPAERDKLFERLHAFGVAGIKVDFFDHEAKETIDLYQAILKDAAEQQLLVDFHGANKPTGEARTWPNEMTREGVRGLEYRGTPAWAEHNTTLPFARFLAGAADYTPVIFGERRKETSLAHQIATAVVFTSPVMVYGANPKSLLESPAAALIKSIPSVWDETRVLAPSAIGELAVFARRSGQRWFLAVLNGPSARTITLDLSFLGKGTHQSLWVKDKGESGAELEVQQETSANAPLPLSLQAGGGLVARFDR